MAIIWLLLLLASLICGIYSQDLSVDAIYYESPPYLYTAEGKFQGMIPQIIKRAKELCKIDIELKVDTNTMENLTSLVHDNSSRFQNLNNKIWMALAIEDIPQEKLSTLNLTELILFNANGLEVIVHRDQIGILPKIGKGVFGCRHFFALIFIMAAGCGVLIWVCVSTKYHYIHSIVRKGASAPLLREPPFFSTSNPM